MLPMIDLRLALGELLAADTSTLAPATANKVALISANFALSEELAVGDLTLATFTGSTPKAGASGAQQAGTDPLTGDQVVTNLTPAGGWRWECTAAPASPETIYGYALLDTTLATLLGAALLDAPVTITSVGDFVDLGAITIRFVRQPMS